MAMKQKLGGKGPYVLWSVTVALLAFGGYLFFSDGGSGGGGGDHQRPPAVVEVETVAPRHFADIIEAIGTARANESVLLTARVSETVQRVNFTDGQMVEKGAILVELTNAEEVALVREADANVLEAERQYERVSDLSKRGNVSQSTMDESVRALDAARSRLSAAEARTADRIIRAPFAGVLGLRSVSPGTLVSPGTQITTLDDVSIIKLDFQVPERFLSALALDQVIVTEAAAYADRSFTGIVRTIASRVDPVTRALTVRAEIPNEDGALKPGMLLTVDLISNERESLAVRDSAVLPVGDDHFVYVIDADSVANMKQVKLGLRVGGFVEVLSGIEAGDRVVSSGTMRLRPGAKVQVKGEAPPAIARQGRQRKDKS